MVNVLGLGYPKTVIPCAKVCVASETSGSYPEYFVTKKKFCTLAYTRRNFKCIFSV